MRRAPILAVAALTAGAAAQTTEYHLDPAGEWNVASAPAPGSDEAAVADARALLADSHAAAARSRIGAWVKANERSGSPWLPAALLVRADAKTADGDEYKALYDYEQIVREFPGSEEFVKAVERELDIGARYVNGYRRRLWGVRFADAADIGEELLVRVQERMPGSTLAERAAIELADYYYRTSNLGMAAEMYDIYLINFPSGKHRDRAMKRKIYSNIGRFKGPRYDGSGLVEE